MPHKVAALFAAAAMFTFGEIVTLPSPVCRVKLIADRFRIGGARTVLGFLEASAPDAGLAQIGHREACFMPLLWIIVLILVILAVGGGLAVNNLVWLLLVVALIVAAFAFMSGRRV